MKKKQLLCLFLCLGLLIQGVSFAFAEEEVSETSVQTAVDNGPLPNEELTNIVCGDTCGEQAEEVTEDVTEEVKTDSEEDLVIEEEKPVNAAANIFTVKATATMSSATYPCNGGKYLDCKETGMPAYCVDFYTDLSNLNMNAAASSSSAIDYVLAKGYPHTTSFSGRNYSALYLNDRRIPPLL